MQILKVEPGKTPYTKEMEPGLKNIQQEVGGLFEMVYLEDDVALCCNEEGKLNGMQMNRRVGDDIICGPFFIVGLEPDEGEFCSLPEDKIAQYTERFKEPEQFSDYEPDAQPRMTFIAFRGFGDV